MTAGVTPQVWFPAPQPTAADLPPDDPPPAPPRFSTPQPAGLGWKAPSRVRVPRFERDAAPENTTPAAPSRTPTPNDETVRMLRENIAPGHTAEDDVVDAAFDPDFREVDRSTPAVCDTMHVDSLSDTPDNPPPKGAESAQAPADPCGRDDATPSDGVVPQGPDEGFRCALWSNGMFEMRTTEGEHLLLNADDTRGLLRYVGDMLSARARAAA